MTIRLNRATALGLKGAYAAGASVRAPCPIHGGEDALSLTERNGKVLWHCFAGCDSKALFEKLCEMGVLHARTKTSDRVITDEGKLAWCRRIWQSTSRIMGEQALSYFSARGIPPGLVQEASAAGSVLRWRARHSEVVARVTDAGGRGIGLHRTMLDRKERRAHGTLKGGAIRLFTEEPGERLGVAEGIETALAFRVLHPELVTWSLISAQGITGFDPPANVREVIVACDFDGAGITAYERLKSRLDIPVRLVLPGGETFYRKDWNDILMDRSTP